MSDLKRIQTNITINNLRVVTFVDFKVTWNVISVKFVIEHKLRTKNKQLILKLYSFNKTKVKEDVTQKLIIVVKLSERLFNVVFNIIDCIKDVFLEYSWLQDHNSIIN